MKLPALIFPANFLLFVLINIDLVQCEHAGQSVVSIASAERQSLPIAHTHDGTNTEGGGVRNNRHTVLDPNEVRVPKLRNAMREMGKPLIYGWA